MVELNTFLPLARTGAFGAVCLFSVIVFCLSAHLIAIGGTVSFTVLSLTTSILTLLTVPAMFVLSTQRRGAFTSFVACEVAWLWILWILWISSAGSTASLFLFSYCRSGICSEVQAIEAFGFLNWLIVMFYTLTLFVLAIMAHLRGHTNVWMSEVLHFDWSAPAVNNVAGVVAPEKHFTGTTVATVNTYQPQQYPAGAVVTPVPQQYPTGVATPVPQQYPPQQPQQQVFVGMPTGGMSQAPQV